MVFLPFSFGYNLSCHLCISHQKVCYQPVSPPKQATNNDLVKILINYLNWSTLAPIVITRIVIIKCNKLYLKDDKINDVCCKIVVMMQKQPKLCHHRNAKVYMQRSPLSILWAFSHIVAWGNQDQIFQMSSSQSTQHSKPCKL